MQMYALRDRCSYMHDRAFCVRAGCGCECFGDLPLLQPLQTTRLEFALVGGRFLSLSTNANAVRNVSRRNLVFSKGHMVPVSKSLVALFGA